MKYFIYKFVVYWKYKIHSENSMSKSILGEIHFSFQIKRLKSKVM